MRVRLYNYILNAILLIFVSGSTCTAVGAEYTLFSKGASAYQILIDSTASTSEKTAAKELQQYINQAGGPILPISNDLDASGPKIILGYNRTVAALTGNTVCPATTDESFTCKTIGQDVVIYGGSLRGTMYGVFDFLEKQLGIHWFTPTCTDVPKMDSCMFSSFNVSESPCIQYRYTNYYATDNQPAWSAHNKENMKWEPNFSEYGNQESYWNAHTMGQFVNVSEFYSSHPEYFALVKGQRTSFEGAQLCLSNPDVLRICKERVLQAIKDNPNYIIYSLSQNDNQSYCECDKCKAIESQYGGHSGLILWFVNQVADTVQKVYPDKYLGTFAYQYSRTPPTGIVPRSNVVIRLCDIECCFAHSLASGCSSLNTSFMNDFNGWSKIAPHLFVWDYIVDFAQYMAPWPNFHSLSPNIQTFHDNNVIGVFEEASYQAAGGEFEEMKNWVVLKLLWNPKQNTDSLARVFIDGYYGSAAQKVYDYYALCQSLVKYNTTMGIYIDADNSIYTDAFVEEGSALLKEALALADNNEIKDRLERLNLQMLYMQSMRNPSDAGESGIWDEFCQEARKINARPSESQNLEVFIRNFVSNRLITFKPSITDDYKIYCKMDSGMIGPADSTAIASGVCLKFKGDTATTWKVVTYANKYIQFINAYSGYALADLGKPGNGRTELGFAIKSSMDSSQLWDVQYVGDVKHFKLKNLYTGNIICNYEAQSKDGQELHGYLPNVLADDSTADNNLWFFKRVSRVPFVPNPNYNYLCYSVNIYMGVRDSTAQTVIPCVKNKVGTETAYQWNIVREGDCYKIKNARLGTVLADHSDASVAINALSLEKSVEGDSTQLWRIIGRKNYLFNLINARNGHIMTFVYGMNNYAISGQTQKANDSIQGQRLWTLYMKNKSVVTDIQTATISSTEELSFDANSRVLRLNGSDAGQARVYSLSGISLGNFSDDGTYSLKGLPAGTYIVRWKAHATKIEVGN